MDNEFEYYGKKKDGLKEGFGIIVWKNNFDYETEITDNNSCYNDAQSLSRVDKQNCSSYIKSEKISIPKSSNNKNISKCRSPTITMHNKTVNMKEKDRETKLHSQRCLNKETKLIGRFHDDKISGIAKYLKTDGCDYKGYLIKNIANGYGIFRSKSGVTYEGEWANDQQHGIGVELGIDESTYKGEFKEGSKCGFGKYNWKDGSVYEGEWLGNSMHGVGRYISSDGKEYYGEFSNSSMHGYGELIISKSEKYYYGFFNQDKKEGFGIFIYLKPHFKAYLGFWKNSKQNGLGKLITERYRENNYTFGENFNQQKQNQDFSTYQTKYGIWENGERIKWIKSSENLESFMLDEEKKYMSYFQTSWENLRIFFDHDDFSLVN